MRNTARKYLWALESRVGTPDPRDGECLATNNTCQRAESDRCWSNGQSTCRKKLDPRVPPFKVTLGHRKWHGFIGYLRQSVYDFLLVIRSHLWPASVGLSRTVSEINAISVEKRNFSRRPVFYAGVEGVTIDWVKKTNTMTLPNGGKKFDDIHNRAIISKQSCRQASCWCSCHAKPSGGRTGRPTDRNAISVSRCAC